MVRSTNIVAACDKYDSSVRGAIFTPRDLSRITEIGVRIRSLIGTSGDDFIHQLEDDISWLSGNNVSNPSVANAVANHVRNAVNLYRTYRRVVG